jgi:hypothetical protein
MLQMLLSDWIVRFFLLYLIVVGGLVFIRREKQTISSPFIRLARIDSPDHWPSPGTWRSLWWDQYNHLLRDKNGIRIGSGERGKDWFWRNNNGLRYA